MNKVRKKAIAFSLAVIYSLVAGLLSGYGYDLYAQKTDLQQNSAQEFYSVITGSQAGGALQPEKKDNVSISTTDDTNKISISEFSALLISPGYDVSGLNLHSTFSASLPCWACKSAIIFPFHYFW